MMNDVDEVNCQDEEGFLFRSSWEFPKPVPSIFPLESITTPAESPLYVILLQR